MPNEKISQIEIIEEIERIGRTEGVIFDNKNLSGIDLRYDVARKLIGGRQDKHPAWYSSSTHGISFRGVGFRNAKIKKSIITQGDFSEASK